MLPVSQAQPDLLGLLGRPDLPAAELPDQRDPSALPAPPVLLVLQDLAALLVSKGLLGRPDPLAPPAPKGLQDPLGLLDPPD